MVPFEHFVDYAYNNSLEYSIIDYHITIYCDGPPKDIQLAISNFATT